MRTPWNAERIGDVILPIGALDPTKLPSKKFLYVDVSSVSNRSFKIEDVSEITGRDAPSRARRLIKEGDVIFATIRPTLRRIAVVPKHLDGQVCSTGYFVFRPTKELYNRFIYHYLFTDEFQGAMESVQTGASYPAVNDAQVKGQTIAFPSISEQKRIVAILDETFEGIDTAVANAETNLANARELFDSYLSSVFGKGGKGWVQQKLGQVCDFEGGSQPPKSEFVYKQMAGYTRFLQIRDFANENNITYIPVSKRNRNCKEDDILIGRYGASVGKILTGKSGSYNVAIIKTIPNLKVVTRSWFHSYLTSRLFQDNLSKVADRSAQAGFSKDDIYNFPIPLPSLTEQALLTSKIEALASETDRLAVNHQRKVGHLTELRQAILRKAFAGQLPTHPYKTLPEAAG